MAAAGAFAFLAVGLAILVRTWSDAAFLAEFEIAWLPWFFVASAVVFLPATIGYAWLARRHGSVRLNTALLALLTSGMLASAAAGLGRAAIFATVLGLSVATPLANVVCWNTILARLDSRQARRLIPLLGGVATLGAIVAGVVGAALAAGLGSDALLWTAVAVMAAMLPLPRILAGSWRPAGEAPTSGSVREGIQSLGRNQLLVVVGLATFLMAITTNIIDYQFKAHLQASLDRQAMGVFLARFHATTNTAVLAIHFFAVGPILRRFGVGIAFGLHPAVVLVGSLVTLWVPTLMAVVGLRFVDILLKFTFHKDTHDLVLNPVPAYDRHQAMVFLKGSIYPLGGIAAGLVLALATGLGIDPAMTAGALVLGFAGAWLSLAGRVRQLYLHQISEGLAIPLRPRPRAPEPAPDALLEKLRAHIAELRHLERRLQRTRDEACSRRIAVELDRLFLGLGRLVDDPRALEAAAERYLHGSRSERAGAVELLDTLLHGHRLPEAAELLDSLAIDSGPGLFGGASRPH